MLKREINAQKLVHFRKLLYLCIRKRNNNKLNPKTRNGREIMKTKDTTINFTSKSGREVIVTVHRKYGGYVEHHHDSENGIDYDTNEFANDHDITVEVPGVCKFETKYLPEMKHLGMDADEVLRLKQISGLASLFKDKDFSKAKEL